MTDGRQPAWDANMECRHGRVPFDPSPRCGCFRIEDATVTELPVKQPAPDLVTVFLTPGEADSLRTAAARLMTIEESRARTRGRLSSWRQLRYRELQAADAKLKATEEAA